jgi:hypothetical protein
LVTSNLAVDVSLVVSDSGVPVVSLLTVADVSTVPAVLPAM